MTNEEVGKKEVFYHRVLAKEEIDTLLEPKVFTNIKKYDEDGEQEVTDFKDTDNLIIKGNNLISLYSIRGRFAGKVKLIYIDPPYNTGSDSFKYNDRFNHSTWLTFMKNRLEIAWELLMEKGLIFMHIGDQEMHYLKVLADSIFGRENFIATIPRKTRNGKSDVPYKLSQDYDWMLIYTKNASQSDRLFFREIDRKYYKTPDFPDDEWRYTDLTKQTSVKERPKSNFTLINPKTGEEYPVNPNRSWSITIDTVDDYIKRGKIIFPGDYDFLKITQPVMRVFKSEDIAKHGENFNKTYVSTEFLNKAMDVFLKDCTNNRGTDEIVELFGEKTFSYPKPEILIQKILEYCTNEGDIVLDFFMGSGTTPAVAMKMNRRFIGIEQMDYINTISVPRLKKVIAGEQGGISKEVNWTGGGSFVYVELYELNQKYIKKIQSLNSHKEIENIIQDIKEKAFLDFKIDIEEIIDENIDFDSLSLEEKKAILIQILDANQMYLSYSEIDDLQYEIPESVKQFNHSFYGKSGEKS
jgi:adenine-specific DNA-methyltransferase